MTGTASILRQFGGLAGGRLVAAVLSFAWLGVAARELTVGEFADFALLLSVGAMVGVVADWGWPILLNEAVAADPRRGWAATTYVLTRRLRLAVLAVVGVAVLYMVAARYRSVLPPLIFGFSLAATVGYTTFTAGLRGKGRVGPDAWNEVVSRSALLGVGVAVLHRDGGLLAVLTIVAAVDLISFLTLGAIARSSLSSEAPVDRSRFALSRVGPLGLASLAGLVYYRADVWLLAMLSSDVEVARYSVCFRVLDGITIPAGALAMIVVAKTAGLDHRSALARADRMVRWLVLGLLPVVAVLCVAPRWVLEVAFGPQYADATTVLRLVALAAVPTVAYLVWSPLVGLRGRSLLPIMAASLVVNLGLNSVLIPEYGSEGAAIATIIGQAGLAVSMRLSLHERESSTK